jgi:hypothetical protein
MAKGPPTSRIGLSGLMAASIGRAKADALVAEACRESGIAGSVLTHTQTLQVLDVIARQPGIVGVSARFAKSRIILGRAQSPPRTPRRSLGPDSRPPKQ